MNPETTAKHNVVNHFEFMIALPEIIHLCLTCLSYTTTDNETV